ncbi:MAG TPA: hypothetical protein VMP11_14255 [Verrucomicrobiae bacterium]|nr:hypothetical protein [Verrucomicrobiae bacterium]
MRKYERYVLAKDAARYFTECLEAGNTLAKCLLDEVDLNNGEIFTFLPTGAKPGRIVEFRNGGLAESKESISYLVSEIQKFLAGDGGRIVLFEDALSRKGDPALAKFGTRMLLHGHEVYHCLLASDSRPERITWTLTQAMSPHLFIGVMTILGPERISTELHGEVSDATLKALAGKSHGIVVGAYDSEGFLIWSRSTQ